MKTWVVGGAVRDTLLGLPVQDRDHVVVGATPQEMQDAGFTPVGKDFPVFLHPRTHEEYALARTERKTAPGYKGFAFHAAPDVTLEQDLARRDLTINAMALSDDGELIDPFDGQRDLRDKVLRHVSPAFAEDPVRILRLARFAARFVGFSVAPETLQLMRDMVVAGEADALVPERVWQELARGLMEEQPSRMFGLLRQCGALGRIGPELDALWTHKPDVVQRVMQLLDAAGVAVSLPLRFSMLVFSLASAAEIDALCTRWRVPRDLRDLGVMTARESRAIATALDQKPEELVAQIERCDALRKPARFEQMLQAVAMLNGKDIGEWPPTAWLLQVLASARGVDAGAVAQRTAAAQGTQSIQTAVRAARVQAVAALPR